MANKAQKIANAKIKAAGGKRRLGRGHFSGARAVKKAKKNQENQDGKS